MKAKKLKEIEVWEYFAPNNCDWAERNEEDTKKFFEWSERGLHKDLISIPTHKPEGRTYFHKLVSGKKWAGIHVHELYEKDFVSMDGSWIGYEELVKGMPEAVVQFIAKEMFKGKDKDIILECYQNSRVMKKALITGITGQDGSYLAELLLEKGYEVHGLIRRVSSGHGNLRNIEHLLDRITLHRGDMGDSGSIHRVVKKVQPDELYNLAAQADVGDSFDMAEYSLDINGNGVYRILNAVKLFAPNCRVYQASTSELFGDVTRSPQNEETPLNPQSPYSIGKLAGYHAIKKARESEGVFACNGFLFNHESERRGVDYVTRKITKGLARIKAGLQKELRLGNLDAQRDWGYSPEYVKAAWMMLQQDEPGDYVIGTGETHTVEEWLDECLRLTGLTRDVVVIDKKFFRPAEVNVLQADYTKANKLLGFEPKVRFKELAKIMVEHDIKQTKKLCN